MRGGYPVDEVAERKAFWEGAERVGGGGGRIQGGGGELAA